MDLQALYDLKERLEHAAIAGTGLLQEDFRLRRAIDALAPLAAAGPVFAKITSATQSLLAAPAEERGKRLLDVLSLVNAVVYTQGAVTVAGDLEPMQPGSGTYVQASYGQLQPLISALRGTGSGRLAQIRTVWETHPEYFRDFRVLPYVIGTLGDPYSELSELISLILRSQGADMIPLLKEGFNGRGKRDMVRRVQLIDAIAGAEENGFYLSDLDGAEKEVRSALIYALRHHEDNATKLVELCQTERGNAKKAAHWALAKLESGIAWTYWDALAEKDLKQAVSYMTLSTAPRAGDLVARALDQWLTNYKESAPAGLKADDVEQLQSLLYALPGKTGDAICEVYRRMAALGTSLNSASYAGPNGQNMVMRLKAAEFWRENLTFSQVVPVILQRSILLNPAPDLMALAKELSRKQALYQIPAVTSALLTGSSEEAFDAAEPCLRTVGLVLKRRPKESVVVLSWVLQDISWDEEQGELAFQTAFTDPAAGSILISRPIREPLDQRWYKYLMAPGGDELTDGYLSSLIYPKDTALREQLGQYFYKRALTVNDNSPYLPWLRKCRWTVCGGLLESYCRHNKVNTWSFINFLDRMPGSPEDKAAEAGRALDLIRNKKIPVGSWNPTQIEKRIAALREQTRTAY